MVEVGPRGSPSERRGYVDGLWGQVHYRVVGAGPPLLLLHQVPWSSAQYFKALPVLAARGMRVIALDTPGYGMSDPPPGRPSIEDHADNLARVLERLELDRPAIAGHHTGALIAGCFASRHPGRVAKCVIDNPPFWTPAEREERQRKLGNVQKPRPGGQHFVDRWSMIRERGDPDWSDESVHLAVLSYFNSGPHAELGYWAAYRYEFAPDLANIGPPTLLLACRRDRLFPYAERVRALRPDFAYVELDGGVAMQLERPADWAAPIASFLKGG